jgi:thiamine biosynthesis protein ThiC
MTHDSGRWQSEAHAGRTQRLQALEDVVSPQMRRVAEREHLDSEMVRGEVAAGRMVIPANPAHTVLDPMGIGVAARVKINRQAHQRDTRGDHRASDRADRHGPDL